MDNALTPMNLLTKVRVLRGVPFDSNYRNVCDDWSNADQQANKISAYVKPTESGRVFQWDAISPIRLQNVIRLPICADFIYDCNYIMWQNANFGSKWFYAFITKVDWINLNCCHVHYQLDVWNTWYFDGLKSTDRTTRGWLYERCFIEREHTNDDTIGANLVPEGIETGEYVWQNITTTNYSRDMSLCALATVKNDYTKFFGVWGLNDASNSFYTGLNVINFGHGATVGANLTSWLTTLATRPEGIEAVKSIVWLPKVFFSQTGDITASDVAYTEDISALNLQRGNSINGYGTPKNNKLLTYPYYFLHITNNQGDCADYRYEYFSDPSSVSVRVYGNIANGVPEMMLFPTNYKGIVNNIDEHISLNNFPQVAWVSNTFLDWLSSNWSNIGSGIMSGAISGAGTIMSGYTPPSAKISPMHINEKITPENYGEDGVSSGGRITEIPANVKTANAVGGANTMMQVANLVANSYIKASLPNTAHGNPSSSLLREFGQNDFFYGKMSIKPQFAKMIDDYFDRFGYATNLTKLPNVTGRSQWNYVKTISCSIQPNRMSLEDVATLEQIFDNGVTIWHHIGNIGNYSLSNPIVNNEGDES